MEEQTQAAPAQAERKDTFDLVTERVIAHLERGVIPWRIPWTTGSMPRSIITNKPYRNVNLVLLSMAGYVINDFLTFKQVSAANGSVKKGEKGQIITIWDMGQAQGGQQAHPRLNNYTVFNVSQCEKLPDDLLSIPREHELIVSIEELIKGMPAPPKIVHKGDEAQYDPATDTIIIQKRKSFRSEAGYYVKLLHLLVHSTGHDSRVPRKELVKMSEYGTQLFSQEEIIAEIGTMFLMSVTGLVYAFPARTDETQGWIAALKADKRLFFSAAREAQKAVDYILKIEPSGGEKEAG